MFFERIQFSLRTGIIAISGGPGNLSVSGFHSDYTVFVSENNQVFNLRNESRSKGVCKLF